ncbi:hypothetical protein HKCCE2091_20215 [Rhodobacterales bacterium HKCCE2091]|nr:hypothetical protein [Rhodobacterales bacterium HKCCE2091]
MWSRFLGNGSAVGAGAVALGLLIWIVDWVQVLDGPDERIRESVVSDIAGAALIVVGAAILIVLGRQKADARDFQRNGRPADAVVQAIDLNFYGTDVILRYEDEAGETHTARLAGSNFNTRPGFGPGDRVAIRYDPANPGRLRFQDTLDKLAPRGGREA